MFDDRETVPDPPWWERSRNGVKKSAAGGPAAGPTGARGQSRELPNSRR